MAPRGGNNGADEVSRELSRLAANLGAFGAAVKDATKAAGGRDDEGGGGGGSNLLRAAGAVGLAGAGIGLNAGVGNFQSSGDFGDSFNAGSFGLVKAIGSIPLIGNVLGATQGADVLQRAGQRAGGVTEDLARYGIEVGGKFRDDMVDTLVRQERQVEDERQAVMSSLGRPEAIGAAGAPGTATNAAGVFAEDIKSIRATLQGIFDAIRALGGGGAS